MRSKSFIGVAVAIALLCLGAVAVYAYDQGREDKIAKGVRVGGIDLSGLRSPEARAKLRAELLQPLSSPVTVRARGKTFHLTAREAKIAANIDEMVREAVAEGRKGNVLSRTLRGVTGGEVQANLQPEVTYSSEAVGRLVSRVRRHVDADAKDATVEFTAAGLQTVEGHTGFAVDKAKLRNRVEAALLRPSENQRIVRAKVREVRPAVSTDELASKYDTAIVVDRDSYVLRLYKGLKLAKTYPIAVGMAGLETPAGLYDIENKQVNPSWHVPNSDWAGKLAGQVIPPGPTNPIKARWMGIIGGAGIHGTTDVASIGSNASHGCIRMRIPDVIDLYDRVPVGSAVYIA